MRTRFSNLLAYLIKEKARLDTKRSAAGATPTAAPDDPSVLRPLPEEPLIKIRPHKSWTILFDLKEVWAHRELFYFLVWRDLKVRYKQTLLGASWVVLQPLLDDARLHNLSGTARACSFRGRAVSALSLRGTPALDFLLERRRRQQPQPDRQRSHGHEGLFPQTDYPRGDRRGAPRRFSDRLCHSHHPDDLLRRAADARLAAPAVAGRTTDVAGSGAWGSVSLP